jgi:Domain of unknown function (DUF1876)
MKPQQPMWRVDVVFTEDDDVTRADAVIDVGGSHYHGWGRSRRNPADPDLRRLGEQVAAARALSDLSMQLRRPASEEIGEFEGHTVSVHP